MRKPAKTTLMLILVTSLLLSGCAGMRTGTAQTEEPDPVYDQVIPGTEVKEGAALANIEASYAIVPVTALKGGKVVDTCAPQGKMVKKGDVIGWVE